MYANLAFFSAPVNMTEQVQTHFSPRCTSNFKCHSTAKLLDLKKCTTLVFGDLEVFKENLVERGKVLTGSKVQGVF
jgi:hypothetical protein